MDRAIDLGPVHDLGRRLPRIPLYFYVINDEEQPDRAKEAYGLLRKLLGNTRWAKLFFFHHGLDYMASRAVSAIHLGLDPNKACPKLVNGVMGDLDIIAGMVSKKLPDIRCNIQRVYKEIRPDVKGALEHSCSDQVLLKYAEDTNTQIYKKYDDLEFVKEELESKVIDLLQKDLKYLVSYALGIQGIPHTKSDVDSLLRGKPVKVKIKDKELLITPEDALKSALKYSALLIKSPQGISSRALGQMRKSIAIFSSLHSGLYHVAFVTDLSSSLIEDWYLSTNKKRLSLAREVLKLYSRNFPLAQIEATLDKLFYFEELKKRSSDLLAADIVYKSLREFVSTVIVLVDYVNELGIDVLAGY